VLLHGGLATAEMSWNTPLSLLAEDFQLVAPDTRAHGGTNHPGGELSYPQFADDLAAFLDAVGIDRPVLIGHGDGGQTALEFGLRYPGRAAGLVLSGTMSEPTADYLAGIRRWGFTGPGDVDIDRIIADFGDDLEPMRAAHGRAGDDAGWLEYLQQISTPWHTVPNYTADQLGGVTDPTLVITGDRDELADLDQAAVSSTASQVRNSVSFRAPGTAPPTNRFSGSSSDGSWTARLSGREDQTRRAPVSRWDRRAGSSPVSATRPAMSASLTFRF
jgi:pimeloyl-ACP methyl ester carboxylesterase